MIPLEKLLEPLSPDNPCGEDPSYHPSFQQLEILARGKPETQVGSEVRPAEDPNWRELRDLAVECLSQSKHLTAGVILTLALLKTDGLAGLAQGLGVVRGLLERYWEPLYPRLDPEENNDPTERMNILNNLASSGDPYRFILRLHQTPLCQSPTLGRVALADILRAKSPSSTPPSTSEAGAATGATGLTASQIEAAFRDSDAETLKTAHTATCQALETVKGIDTFLSEKVSAGRGANLEALQKSLAQMESSLAPFVGVMLSEAAPETGERSSVAPGTRGGTSAGGAIRSREDVVRVLEQVCEYYRQHEPSSPVPFLLKRAQRLVKMNFMEIVGELTPDSMSLLKAITGPEDHGGAAPG